MIRMTAHGGGGGGGLYVHCNAESQYWKMALEEKSLSAPGSQSYISINICMSIMCVYL